MYWRYFTKLGLPHGVGSMRVHTLLAKPAAAEGSEEQHVQGAISPDCL